MRNKGVDYKREGAEGGCVYYTLLGEGAGTWLSRSYFDAGEREPRELLHTANAMHLFQKVR